MGQFALEQVRNCSGATTELSRYGMLFFWVPVGKVRELAQTFLWLGCVGTHTSPHNL